MSYNETPTGFRLAMKHPTPWEAKYPTPWRYVSNFENGASAILDAENKVVVKENQASAEIFDDLKFALES